MTVRSYEDQTRADAVIQIEDGVLQVINQIMETHGDDPQAYPIIGAGLLRAIKRIGQRNPDGAAFIRALLGAADDVGMT